MCHRLNKKANEFKVKMYQKKCQHKEVPWQLQHMYREGCLKSRLYLHSFACDLLMLCIPSAFHIMGRSSSVDSSACYICHLHRLKKGWPTLPPLVFWLLWVIFVVVWGFLVLGGFVWFALGFFFLLKPV